MKNCDVSNIVGDEGDTGLRIGISGAQGVGKTTLARELASRFNWMLLEEQFRFMQPKESSTTEMFTPKCPLSAGRSHWNLLNTQVLKENDLQRFIADRTTVDIAAYWLKWHAPSFSSRENLRYYRRCQKQAKQYDLVFYLPVEFALTADGFRSMDADYQAEMDWLIYTLLQGMVGPKKTCVLHGNLESRVRNALKHIQVGRR